MRERNPDWSNTLLNIHDVDGAYTVLQSDSGKVFMLSSTGGACEITLPVAANLREGWNCKFVVKEDTPTGVITIAAGSAIIDMVMKDPGGNASNSTVGTAKSNILLRATCTQGDYVNVFTDGSTYYAEAISGIDDAIDFS
jgi:uncharacterized protein YwbE|tara:strand:+ start:94 stop:513 length:420 start_codon:yes stop_codon:yes gene_type:complete